MTTVVKPKERQFQVVPVPAVFTRGRWECVDYKDNNTGGSGISGALSGGNSASFTIGGGSDQQQTIEFDKSAGSTGTAAATPLATQMLITTPGGNGLGGQYQHQTTGSEMTQASAQQNTIPTTSSVPHFDTSTGSSQSVPTNVELMAPSISSADSINMPNGNATSITTTTSIVGQNAVAIDNKIEQAMDLVKTHLTFAVREEVEILRSTIMDLESRVNNLEHENQILRQFAPLDVVSNLATLVQAAVQHQLKAVAAVQQAQQQKMQTVPSAPVIMDHIHQQHIQQFPQQHPQLVGHSPTPTGIEEVQNQ